MTLAQLRYLIAVADADLNVSRAARQIHSTQPAVSKQLRQLEDELGFRIFSRKGRRLDGVTTGGAQVIEHARLVLAETRRLRAFAAARRAAAGAASAG